MRLGSYMTEESRAKMSAAQMGKIVSPETRAKLSAVGMGHAATGPKHFTAESRAKMSTAEMGNTKCLGRIVSAKTRAKTSAANKEAMNRPEVKAKISAARWRGGLKIAYARSHAKRRTLGFHALNSPFPGCDAHHINPYDVIHMPHKLHNSIYHNQNTGQGMAQMNALAGQYLTEDWT